jgi:hypothetical protein
MARPTKQDGKLFRAYTIGIETLWDEIEGAAKQKNQPLSDRIRTLIASFETADDPMYVTRWRNAYIVEQLMAQFLPEKRLIEEGEKRLFEAKALNMRSADEISNRWNAARKAAPIDQETILAIYSTLIDDLHWMYNKRSLDRDTRSALAKGMSIRAWITLSVCVVPFLFVLALQNSTFNLWNWIPAESRPAIAGCYIAISVGSLGALFSRLVTFQQRYSNLDFDGASSNYVGRVIYIRQAIGAIGALLLYFAVFGKLIGGQLFPEVAEILKHGSWLNSDFAKLVVWSFIGGFSEQMVPDFLTRTEANAVTTMQKNT